MYSKALDEKTIKVGGKTLTVEEVATHPNIHLEGPALITGTVDKPIEIKQTYRGTMFSGNVNELLAQLKNHAADNSSPPALK